MKSTTSLTLTFSLFAMAYLGLPVYLSLPIHVGSPIYVGLPIASAGTALKLPSYTPNNPRGTWIALPKGKNYLFCGDRILYGVDFNKKIKLTYDNETKEMTLREHCSLRRRAISYSLSKKTSEDPTLIEMQYNKINRYLSRIRKKKGDEVYSYRELLRTMGPSVINELRVANIMLPILSHDEFGQIYVGDSNNKKFIDTEYERYASNLITQNPAMLYTAEGSLFYFSMNLSEEQLRLLGSVVSRGGGGGAGSSGPSSGGGNSGSASNPSVSPRDLASAGREAKLNPFEGFKFGNRALRVRPQATVLPAKLGVARDATFVPYNLEIPRFNRTNGGDTNSRNVASGSRSRAKSSSNSRGVSGVSGVSISSSPGLTMMGMRAPGAKGSVTAPGNGFNAPGRDSPKTNISSSASKLPETNIVKTAKGPAHINAEKAVNVASAGPPPIQIGGDWKAFGDETYSCKPFMWAHALQSLTGSGYDMSKECVPQNLNVYCGTSAMAEDYKKCLKGPEIVSCNAQVEKDIHAICSQYVTMDKELNQSQLIRCAETVFALACGKIPCEIIDNEGTLEIKDLKSSQIFKKNTRGNLSLKNFEEISKLPVYSRPPTEWLKRKKESPGSDITLKTELNQSTWPNEVFFETQVNLVRLGLFYRVANSCENTEVLKINESSQ